MRMPLTVAAACLALLLGGCGALRPTPPHVTESESEPTASAATSAEPAAPSVSPNGTLSVVLPERWSDLSEVYFAATADSVLTAFWAEAAPGSKAARLDHHGAFVSASVTLRNYSKSVADVSLGKAQEWANDFNGEISATTSFTTDAHGEGAWTMATFTKDGYLTHLYAIMLDQGEQSAWLFLESRPGEGEDGITFLDALPSLVLSATTVTIEGRGEDGSPAAVDGRWHSAEGSISMRAQPGWTYTRSAHDAIGPDPTDGMDYLGQWEVGRAGHVVLVMAIHGMTITQYLALDPGGPGEPTEVDVQTGMWAAWYDADTATLADGRQATVRDYMYGLDDEVYWFYRSVLVDLGNGDLALVYLMADQPISDIFMGVSVAAAGTVRAEQ